MSHNHAHEFIPVFARASFEYDFVVTVTMIDPGDSDFEHEAGPAGVRDDQVAASAQNKQRKISGFREFDRLGNFGSVRRLNEIAG